MKLIGQTESGYVQLTGTVEEVRLGSGAVFIELCHQEAVRVVVFDDVSLKDGDVISVMGRLSSYGNESEIVADKIKLISSSP